MLAKRVISTLIIWMPNGVRPNLLESEWLTEH